MYRATFIAVYLSVGLWLAPVQAEPIGTVFTYQGQLKQGGGPVDATCVFEFSLHDAMTGGTQVGPTLRFDGLGKNPPAVAVVNGLFQAELNFGSDAFNGDALWLQTAVCCDPTDCTDPLNLTTLDPRQQLTATPYALHTRGIASNENGYIGIGTNSPDFPLEVQTSAADTAVFVSTSTPGSAASGSTGEPAENGTRPIAVEGESSAMGGVGLSGDALATMGDGRGVLGRSSAESGVGVLGRAFHPTGCTIGVSGEVDSPDGIGVVGTARVGVEGRADAAEGTGVRGVAILLNGRTVGVEGTSDSSDGVGVFGLATATKGIAVGVQGESDSPEGTGVVGSALNKGVIGEATDPAAGVSNGVLGRSASSFGTGVRGEANSTEPGFGVGVVGITQNNGRGVLGFHAPSSGFGVGVEGCSTSPEGIGVSGIHNVDSGEGAGVSGSTFSPDGIGVKGEHESDSGEGGGVLGSTSSPDGFAGMFLAPAGNQGALTVANEGGDARVEVATSADDTGLVRVLAPNGSDNVLFSNTSGNAFNGFIGVGGFTGSTRAKMFVEGSGAGTVQTLGFNGSSNVVIGTSGASGDARNQGAIEIVDENEATLIDLAILFDEGNIQVSDATGSTKLTMKSQNSAGSILTQGPNGLANVYISNTNSNLNLGSVWVGDTFGQPRAEMFVDEQGAGVIIADEIAAAVKNFRVPHPDQPGSEIWYACVEGPEAAAYTRGTATLVDGQAIVTLPDHFRAIAVEAGMTVQLTPLSADSLGLAVVRKSLEGVVVKELHAGRGNYDFDYRVTAVRKGYEDYRVVRPTSESVSVKTRQFIPRSSSKRISESEDLGAARHADQGGAR